MVTIYDMASGVIRRASTAASDEANSASVSLDQPQSTERLEHSFDVEEQLALREHECSETTLDNVNKIPHELASINTDKFISGMEK